MSLWVILLIAFLGLLIYFLTRSHKPQVYYNKDGQLAPVFQSMKSLITPYRPTPWLLGGHLHTIWGMRYRPSWKKEPRRQKYEYADKGYSYFDWFEEESTPVDAPVLIIFHTMNGGTREPCVNQIAYSAVKQGYRAVVANCRGCSGGRIVTKKIFDGISVDDTQELIDLINSEYKPRAIFAVGYSLGAYQGMSYVINSPQLDGFVAISHTYDPNYGAQILQEKPNDKLYRNFILAKMAHMLEKSSIEEFKGKKFGGLRDLHEIYVVPQLGLNNVEEYYEMTRIKKQIAKCQSPVMIVGSLDDPFTYARLIPKEEAKESQNVCVVTVPEGGHVGFCKGFDGKRSWAEDVIMDFCNTILNNKEK